MKDAGDEIGVLVTGAYEWHSKVNRSSDILGIYGSDPNNPVFVAPPIGVGAGDHLYAEDIADEDAAKVGVQFKLPTKTTISGIFESMHRYVAADLQFQNERQRNRTWFAVSQDITPEHNVAFGWGHAFKTPGDPCQHNDCTRLIDPVNGIYVAPNNNSADMITLAWFYKFHPGWTWYIDYAATFNSPSAHYDLAQGGGAATTDCHDASGALGGIGSNPHCWTGGVLQGVQTGVRYQF
ncbi:MAG: hypothetical protein WBX25_02025 [Rhodomicrobium sp.]